jgi:uncharacterized protein
MPATGRSRAIMRKGDQMKDGRRVMQLRLRSPAEGTQRQLTAFAWGAPGARPKAYFQAAIHAGEMTGTLALDRLGVLLDEAAESGRITGEVILAPLCNPIGYSQFLFGDHAGRFESGGRGNFNRDHLELSADVAALVQGKLGGDPAANVAAIRAAALECVRAVPHLTEMISWRATLLGLAIDADVVLDIHSDLEAAVFMYVNGGDWPGARDLAAELGCVATLLNIPYATGATFAGVVGSLWPRLAGHFGASIPIPPACLAAMLELRGRHAVSDSHADDDAGRLFRFLQRRLIVAGDPGPLPPLLAEATPVTGMDVGYAPFAGPVVYRRRPGERIRSGDTICAVLNPLAENPADRRAEIAARADGVLYARPLDGMVVYPGQVLFRVAGAAPLAHRSGRSWLDD